MTLIVRYFILFLVLSVGCKNSTPNKGTSIPGAISNKSTTITGAPKVKKGFSHSDIVWKEIGKGLEFSKAAVFLNGNPVDSMAVVRIDPRFNRLRAFCSYEAPGEFVLRTIFEWQEITGASVIFNSAQYRADPYACPLALMVCDGKVKGKDHPRASGLLVAEPKDSTRPRIDLLDLKYDFADWQGYSQVVQHWPILLDRSGNIRADKTDWQANRTVVAKDRKGKLLVFTTLGGYFTLYNFGKFLKNSKFNVEVAMNLDGGYEAEMCIKTKGFSYVAYGQFETKGLGHNISIPGIQCPIPAAIGIFPRK